MALVSRAPEAKTYLLTLLRAVPTLSAATVAGYPVTDADKQAENVYVDNVDFTQSWRGIGCRNDDFTVNLVVMVRKMATPDAVDARTWEIVTAIQNAVHADPVFGGILNVAAEVSGGQVSPYPAGIDGQWEARADVRVRCQAVLSE